jgi:TRAP-type C4-dicarboxylate transport system permease small subunit
MAGRALRKGMAHMVEGAVGLLMAALCLTIVAGVVSRYVVGRPLAWTDEAARYLFIWVSFLGAAVAVRRRANFKLDLIAWRGAVRSRTALELGGNLFTILLACCWRTGASRWSSWPACSGARPSRSRGAGSISPCRSAAC